MSVYGAVANLLWSPNSCYNFSNPYKARRHEAIKPQSVCDPAVNKLRWAAAPALGLTGALCWAWIASHPGHLDLASGLDGCRLVEARLSFEHKYAAYSSGSRRCLSDKALAQAAKSSDTRKAAKPSADSYLSRGWLKLLDGRHDEAVRVLEDASRQFPDNPKVWNDLAAAYIAAASQEQPENLIRALASAQRAIKLDGSFSAAVFNLALALELLYPTDLAVEAWQRYLQLDRESDWAEEARSRLARLQEPSSSVQWTQARNRLDQEAFGTNPKTLEELAKRFPQQVRMYVEETLLPRWGERTIDGKQAEASALLQMARGFGISLERQGGDRMVADAVLAIDEASAMTDGLQSLAAGHRDFGHGLIAYGNGDIQNASALFRSSAENLRRGKSPFVSWAEYQLAVCYFQHSDYPAVQRSLASLLTEEVVIRYPNLAGKAFWLRGLTHLVQAELTDSLASYLQARDLFSRTGEAENLAVVHNLLAENFRHLGDSEGVWEYLHRALAASREVQTPRRIQVIAREAGDACLELGEPSVALLFEEAALRTLPDDDGVGRASALQKLARIHLRLGDEKSALAVLDEAMEATQRVPDPELRESLRGDILLAKGHLASREDLSLAAESLNEALEIYRRTQYWRPVPGLLLKRALVHLGQGQEDLAVADLRMAVQEVERQRSGFSEERARVTFLDSLHEVFDRWVELDIQRGDFGQAFNHAEQGQARALLDVLAGREGRARGEPLTLVEIQRHLPEQTALVVYVVLPNSWGAWVVRRNGFEFVQSHTPEEMLNRMISRFRRVLQRGTDEEVRSASQELSRELLLPIMEHLSGSELVVFVPDKVLHRLPFGALLNPTSKRFLIEQYTIAKAPSATIYLETLERSRQLGQPELPSLLVVGDPALDRERFPHLDSLHFAREEAARIASVYPGASSLIGEAATKGAFSEAAINHEVIHFAGHGISNTKFPQRAGLLFAPEPKPGDSPLLSVSEIERMSLPRTRLVVLSACSSGDGRISAGEGVLGIARPFLAIGVPVVVGSLWKVRDEDATDLMIEFHQRLRAGKKPLSALRDAQRAMLTREAPPRAWAAFEIVGGGEPLQRETRE